MGLFCCGSNEFSHNLPSFFRGIDALLFMRRGIELLPPIEMEAIGVHLRIVIRFLYGTNQFFPPFFG